MRTAVIGPNQNARIRYHVPSSHTFEFDVNADHGVKTYIMRSKGLELFDSGAKNFKYYGGFQDPPRRHHHQELMLPFEGAWYLVIVNPSKSHPVQVKYEVSF